VASLLISPSPTRDRLTSDVYLPTDLEEPVAALEAALAATIEAEPLEAKVRKAIRAGSFKPGLLVGGGVDAVYDVRRLPPGCLRLMNSRCSGAAANCATR
jgi:acyl-CoA dehydrogenase